MTILIVAAMDREISSFQKMLSKNVGYHQEEVLGFIFYFGRIKQKDIILVKSGVGRVHSGILMAIVKEHYNFDYCINIGIAGGYPNPQLEEEFIRGVTKKIELLDIVVGVQTVYGDADLTPLKINGVPKYVYGQMSGCPPTFQANATLVQKIKECSKDLENIHFGTIVSREKFTYDLEEVEKLVSTYFPNLNVLAFDMESACLAQAAYRLAIPFLSLRIISDIIGENNQVSRFMNTEDKTAASESFLNFIIDFISSL